MLSASLPPAPLFRLIAETPEHRVTLQLAAVVDALQALYPGTGLVPAWRRPATIDSSRIMLPPGDVVAVIKVGRPHPHG